MPIVDTKKMFEKANKLHYAVGAFNVDSFDGLQAVVDAAEKCQSPVIVALTERSFYYMRPDYIYSAMKVAEQQTDVPIALHLDHGKSFEACKIAIDSGFTSVMIDGSAETFDNNVQKTKEVVDYAHKHGVVVEGELGSIAGIEDSDTQNAYGHFTNPNDVKKFVELTGVDSLAIAVGTAHGVHKFKPNQIPQLRFDILAEIEQMLPHFPLVLHGASSVPQEYVKTFNTYGGQIADARGIPEEMLKKVLNTTVCKINICSDLRVCFLGSLRKTFAQKPSVIDIRDFLIPAREDVLALVEDKMANLLNSKGQG